MSILLRLQRRGRLFSLAFILLIFSGLHHLALAQSGKLLSDKSKKGYSKSNQSKVFFHDGKWWALAFETNTDQWFIWQFANEVWTAKSPTGNLSSSARPDVVLNAASNKLYALFPNSKTTDFYRFSYGNGAWVLDAGFPRALTTLGAGDSKTPASLVRALNGELWIFRIDNKIVQALRSNDEGMIWSGIITVKAALNYKRGLTDAQAFTAGGKNYIGVAYGETEKAGVKTRFGFLSHRDGDPENSWSDESAALTMMGKENSTSNLSLAVDADNQLYLFTQNDSAAGADPRNTLYKRNATTGLWQAFKVNTAALWTSPAIAIQGTSKLFLMGVNTGTGKGEYKIVSITKENLAATATANPLFDSGIDLFADLSVPSHAVDATTQLMICSENTTAGKIWYNRLEIGGNTGGGGGGGCTPQAAAGPAAIAGTRGSASDFYKPNQSKVFFHAGTWWAVAPSATESAWFLWKKMGSVWTKELSLATLGPASIKLDCYIDTPNNKLYLLAAQNSAKVLQLTYNPNDGTFAPDLGFPVTLTGFSYQSEDASVITRAKNGELWVVGSRAGAIFARRSSNDGQTWTADIKLKTLNVSLGLVDVVTFTSNGQNCIGVGYAEDTDPVARYGFLIHKDGDADNIWVDETSQLVMPTGAQADDHINLAVSANNEVFMVVKTKPGAAAAPGINLYKRATNGGWSSFTVFKASQETRPAVVIDETNNELYVFTTLLSAPRFGRYKKCLIGEEATLATATVSTFFQIGSDDFYNVSAPPHRVNACTGLLIAAENNTNAKIWYQIFPIKGGDAPPPTAAVVGNVTATPTTVNQNAAYMIPLTLGATGNLTAGNTITVVWPNGTTLPATMANTAVSVNGMNATSIATTPATRQAVVTIPANIAGGSVVTLSFAVTAGILNPAAAANYTLIAKTTAQPLDAVSPLYTIGAGVITPVTIGTITANPDTVNRAASHTISLTLGATGGLAAGAGTITLTWPNDFTVPATMANTTVTVNGINAAAVTSNASTRQAVITVPSAIASGATVNLVFLKTAGIKNATNAGDYTLQAQTSAQPLNANSPALNLKPANIVPPDLGTGRLLASRTKAPYDKSSQSKIFYLGGKWWTAALDSADAKWYLFSYNGSTWTRIIQIDSRSASRADFAVDAASNRLYALVSQSTATYFNRLLYTSGSWSLEAQVPLAGFEHGTGANVVTLTRAKNGFLWIFRINNGMLETQVSMDNGNSWSSTMMLKSGLAGLGGQTDAVTFGSSVGVFYAMNVTTTGARFGFLKHLDSDPVDKWDDESSQFTFFSTENAENWVSANATSDGVVYAITRNKKVNSGDPTNTLHKRSISGVWSKYKVNSDPMQWTSPTLALDATNKRLYVMGIRIGTLAIGEYKWCALGNESTLESAPVKELFKNDTDNFGQVSAPLAAVTNATGLMLVASNATRDDLWFNHINLSLAKSSELANAARIRAEEAEIDNFTVAQVYPNPFNPSTSFRFAVKAPTNVTLQIFNIRGELVRTLIDGEYNRGVHEKRWHGRDNAGNQVASGLYFYRLQIGNRMLSGRMQMLK